MSNLQLYSRLNRLKDDVVRLKNAIYAYETTDSVRYPENFESLGIDMAMKAEAIACSVRNIVSIYPNKSRKKLISAVIESHGIEVKNTQDGYEIIMPGLMPKRNFRNNSEFLLEPLASAVEDFSLKNDVQRIEKAIIHFIYEYIDNTPPINIRDYDNLEAKEVLDVINSIFLLDDSGEFCELHYSTRRSERNCTRVIISKNTGQLSYQKKETI